MTDTRVPVSPSPQQAGSTDTGHGNAFTATDSPCIAVCSTLFDDICRGCGRTAMEVANWVLLDDAEKRVIWARIRAQGYPRKPR
jgi:predicted Fe-S protein YdhL (DUF1289 family)